MRSAVDTLCRGENLSQESLYKTNRHLIQSFAHTKTAGRSLADIRQCSFIYFSLILSIPIYIKKSFRIFAGYARRLFIRNPFQHRNSSCPMLHIRRLVFSSAERLRCQIRRICLHQKKLNRNFSDNLLCFPVVFESYRTT